MADHHREFYAERIARVLRYIGTHLDGDLSADTLSRVAGFSKYHFHRQFREITGVSVGKLIGLLRLKRASLKLALSPEERIIDIAMQAGFEAPESFARAFKRAQGQSPSQFRSSPHWERWVEVFRNPAETRSDIMTPRIVEFPRTRVACLEHRGPEATVMRSVQRFIEWRKSCDVSPVRTSMTIGITRGDPETNAPDTFPFDICGSVLVDVPDNDHGVIEKVIPGGRCAVARHLGSTDTISATVHALYADWLPGSGEELRDFPCFFHYIDRMPAVAEHEQVTDVYLPLK
jgi:AraC family transcriptional regulator